MMSEHVLGTKSIDVPCPWCKVDAGEPCKLRRGFHVARHKLAVKTTRDRNRRARLVASGFTE